MSDPRIDNLAKILVQYSTKIKPGEQVAIESRAVAFPLVRAIFREVLHAGGHPYVLMAGSPSYMPGLADLDTVLLAEGSDDQLQHVNPFAKMVMEEFDARIVVLSSENTRAWSNLDPSRFAMVTRAHTGVIKIYKERSASGALKWVGTLYPTEAYAQDAEMSLGEFEDYVYGTTYADTDDPIGAWNAIHEMQQVWVDWLAGKKMVQVRGPNIDLELSIEGRSFINSDGTRNMPSGEIFTSPVEHSTSGWARFTYPVAYRGREVDGVEFHFENGRVVKASAKKNEAFLLSMLDTDAGSRYLGEFAIGTNKKINRFIKNILFDEKIGGTIHMAIGFGFPEVGSKNESAIHWDFICDMRDGGQIFVDGELLYDSGEFKV
jgi:aminopeptidase